MTPRSEPLLWLQLIALGAIPLELLGLLLLLAGADPGPLPGLERLLAWAIGALGPAILLWKRPADVGSLLLVQVPLRARSEAQRTLSALQSPVALKLTMVGGAAALLPLFWWMDQHAALAASLSPLAASPRLVGLLLACPLLALILWQWQQLTQALALLRIGPEAMAAVTPLTASQLESQRLNLGLPLLLLSPLEIPEPEHVRPQPEVEREPEPENTPISPN
ncbi:MAG: low-complexity tail membrane protein [Cyanobium sp. LacPavin_0818_WC50_MAG_67_9]|nr:low-complexity tail membrane protein [Cyanobium sp. LacPavin_0818_WC50_MAG_67_9]